MSKQLKNMKSKMKNDKKRYLMILILYQKKKNEIKYIL